MIAYGYDEIIDFIAHGPSVRDVANFRVSAEAKALVRDLIEREKTEGLSRAEKDELDHCMKLEHIMRMARAKAKLQLRDQP